MSKTENSMRQYLFKTFLVDLVSDFVKTYDEDASSEEITDCVEYMENLINDLVPSTEWNIRVHEEDSDSFDEFIKEQMQTVVGLLGIIVSSYFMNLKLLKNFKDYIQE